MRRGAAWQLAATPRGEADRHVPQLLHHARGMAVHQCTCCPEISVPRERSTRAPWAALSTLPRPRRKRPAHPCCSAAVHCRWIAELATLLTRRMCATQRGLAVRQAVVRAGVAENGTIHGLSLPFFRDCCRSESNSSSSEGLAVATWLLPPVQRDCPQPLACIPCSAAGRCQQPHLYR